MRRQRYAITDRNIPHVSGIYRLFIGPEDSIGSSLDIHKRARVHRARFLRGKNDRPLQSSFELYGLEAVSLMILEEVPLEQLEEREAYWTKRLAPTLYSGRRVTRAVNDDEGRERQSRSIQGDRNQYFGKHLPRRVRQKLSESAKAYWAARRQQHQ